MHWVVEEASLSAVDEQAYFASELDTDGDGKLGLNELRTLVALQLGLGAAQAAVIKGMRRMVNCLNGREPDDPLAEADSVVLHFSFVQIMACDATATALRAALPLRQTFRVHDVKGPDSCVAFERLSDDVEHVHRALDSIRARKPRFICVNDNMQQPSPHVLRALRDLYDALCPLPSQLELRTCANIFLALDETRRTPRATCSGGPRRPPSSSRSLRCCSRGASTSAAAAARARRSREATTSVSTQRDPTPTL
jgi:hypothetical protein